jgi:hypothetical protein
MPVVLIPVAWLAVLILMMALCRAAARADASAAAVPAEEPEILAGGGPSCEEIPLQDQVGSIGSASGRFAASRVGSAGRRRAGCAPGA